MEDFFKQQKRMNFLYDLICAVGFVLTLFVITCKILMIAK